MPVKTGGDARSPRRAKFARVSLTTRRICFQGALGVGVPASAGSHLGASAPLLTVVGSCHRPSLRRLWRGPGKTGVPARCLKGCQKSDRREKEPMPVKTGGDARSPRRAHCARVSLTTRRICSQRRAGGRSTGFSRKSLRGFSPVTQLHRGLSPPVSPPPLACEIRAASRSHQARSPKCARNSRAYPLPPPTPPTDSPQAGNLQFDWVVGQIWVGPAVPSGPPTGIANAARQGRRGPTLLRRMW